MIRTIVLLLLLLQVPIHSAGAQGLDLVWPTPNTAFRDGRGLGTFVQPTVSGDTESGLFGCVRTDGTQFHEGLDLFPIQRSGRGEPTDRIVSALAGVVRHVNNRPGTSSYGRYLVLEHPEQVPAVYTLYAHLSAIEPGVAVGQRVSAGQTLGTMGRSAGGYTIPRDRAHLHFEIGVRLTDEFQSWYQFRKFGSPNQHGVWNGMNLAGIDPLDFFTRVRDGQIGTVEDYFARMEPAVRIRIASSKKPDFLTRYPALAAPVSSAETAAGWEVSINTAGVPFSWKPLSAVDLIGYRSDEVRVVYVNEPVVEACRCKSLVTLRRGAHVPGGDLETLVQLLFGLH